MAELVVGTMRMRISRAAETVSPKLPTGEVELRVEELAVQSAAELLPLQVNAEEDAGEETRLRYRYLDLRRPELQRNLLLRDRIDFEIRRLVPSAHSRRRVISFSRPTKRSGSPISSASG